MFELEVLTSTYHAGDKDRGSYGDKDRGSTYGDKDRGSTYGDKDRGAGGYHDKDLRGYHDKDRGGYAYADKEKDGKGEKKGSYQPPVKWSTKSHHPVSFGRVSSTHRY